MMGGDDLESPTGTSQLLWRSWIVVVTGLVLWSAIDVAFDLRSAGSDLVVLAWVLLIVAPVVGVVAWQLAASPRPDDARYAKTLRELEPRQRREIDRSLRRGVAAAAAGWPLYARARAAQCRRGLITLGPITMLVWSQLLLQPVGGGFFWVTVLAGVAVTTTGVLSVAVQLRREHALTVAGLALSAGGGPARA
ncbi:hypothetical protein [Pseudonocardia sp. EC080625-04]|nr:hypothetical protein [Pseudonocardia sp. EC080625-04]